MSSNITVIQHLDFENLGTFTQPILNAGFKIETHLMARDAFPQHANLSSILIVLGGPISANDQLKYPFLTKEIDCIRDRLERQLPTLGICLGAQLIAKAMGAKIEKAPQSEIGWFPVKLTEEGLRSPLKTLDKHPTTFHFHGEMFEIPETANRLAFSEKCPNQAFSFEKTLAIQFHPEVTSQGLESWYVGHCHEVESTPHTSVTSLRENAAKHNPTHQQLGPQIIQNWIKDLNL